ncbi:MAG: hypothetical protein JF591_18220 [Lysobacter sp.]|nr:hypothetical protein [Lysobacter sp.]
MSASTGAATSSAGCFCSVVYYNDVGTVVGIRQPAGCGDPGWGVTSNKSKVYAGCVM